MDQYADRICCHDVHECAEKAVEAIHVYNKEKSFDCITEHPGFIKNCLRFEVLENAWLTSNTMVIWHVTEKDIKDFVMTVGSTFVWDSR